MMEWLRRALGLALLGAAVWLLSVLATEAGLRSALAAGAALLALLILLAARGVLRFDRYGSTVLGAAAVVVAVVAVLAPSLYGRAAPIETASRAAQTGLWRRYDAAALQRLVGEGKVVLVDVSAAWCLTCKVNELTVLERAPVADKLHEPSVVAMRANWTRPDPTITAYLQSFGRYGVPLDAVYGPGVRGGIASPELLNSAAVMDAFQRAASSPAGHQEAKK